MEKEYLHRRFVVKLGATDGTGSYKTAKEVFKGGLDPCFKRWGVVFSGIAPEMDITGDNLIKDGMFTEFLGTSIEKLERCRMLGAQFLKLCQDNPDKFCQKEIGCTTFVVLTKNDKPVKKDFNNVLVAGIRSDVYNELFYSYVFRFDDDVVWSVENHQYLILCPSISA